MQQICLYQKNISETHFVKDKNVKRNQNPNFRKQPLRDKRKMGRKRNKTKIDLSLLKITFLHITTFLPSLSVDTFVFSFWSLLSTRPAWIQLIFFWLGRDHFVRGGTFGRGHMFQDEENVFFYETKKRKKHRRRTIGKRKNLNEKKRPAQLLARLSFKSCKSN